MHYQLYYTGTEDGLTATLTYNGKTVATERVKDKKAAHKWAQRVARDHKLDNTPEATEYHSVAVSGSKNFSV